MNFIILSTLFGTNFIILSTLFGRKGSEKFANVQIFQLKVESLKSRV